MTAVGPHDVGCGRDVVRAQRDLKFALLATVAYCAVEVIGGLLSNSLALLSDAGHMFADAAALGISFFALRLSQLPPTASKTYGYHRVEILAAFVNGLALWLVVGLIFSEAVQRFADPQPVHSAAMLGVAAVGLGVNISILLILRRSRAESLNVRSAFVHVFADALGSIGAVLAGVVMLWTGWYQVDPLVSVGIGLLILGNAWGVVRESVDILMQGTPRDIRLGDIEYCLATIDGVREVHDLHLWTLTSGRHLLSVHLVVCGSASPQPIVAAAQQRLLERFGISHSTVQIDHDDACMEEFRAH